MIANRFLAITAKRQLLRPQNARCFSGFSFAGPKTLEEILKKDLVGDKSATEVADLWYSYHESKVTKECPIR
jgi:hypothetical protein